MSAVPSLPAPLLTTNGVTTTIGGDTKSTTNGDDAAFQLDDHPIENFRPLKVIVIGAGYSGIYHSIRIPERLRNVELVVYEKNAGVGGTWYENRYASASLWNSLILLPRSDGTDIHL